MTGPRRLSQAISEGDGISLIASVRSAEEAPAVEEAGAEAFVVTAAVSGLREATSLPILWRGRGSPQEAEGAGADAWVIDVGTVGDGEGRLEELQAQVLGLGLEPVVEVRDEEELDLALERLDPEIFLLSAHADDDEEDSLDQVLDLLPDVPAGKLAIASSPGVSRDDVLALERAGIDGVLVEAVEVAGLLTGEQPPAV